MYISIPCNQMNGYRYIQLIPLNSIQPIQFIPAPLQTSTQISQQHMNIVSLVCQDAQPLTHNQPISIPNNTYTQNSEPINISNTDSLSIQPSQFKCSLCDKIYKRESNLKSHIKKHTEELYKCAHCHQTFNRKQNLKQHIRIHKKVKPHKCSFCDKAFTQKHTLLDHERVHRGEKPFKCDYCYKQFAAKCNLITHRRIHTGETPYECKECNKQYHSKSGYNSHRKRHHK
eukprot:111587_1